MKNAAPQSGKTSPSPWKAVEEAHGTSIIAADGSRAAYVHSCSCNREADADARLIAAAPELLEACEALLKHINAESGDGEFEADVDFHDGAGGTDLRRAFEDAIAKANGT
jgi:hypothetical protein